MADERRVDSLFSSSKISKQPPPAHAHLNIPTIATPPPSQQMNHYSLNRTPPPAHLRHGLTPPPPHVQVPAAINNSGGSSGGLHTPPPAHMNEHRSSPGLQLLGHIASSPQLHVHSNPSPHLSIHSGGSPAQANLLNTDRPTSRESYTMTPPRAQVFPLANIQPELIKVLRPGLTLQHFPSNNLALPNGPFLSASSQSLLQQAAIQQSISNQLQQAQFMQAIQNQQIKQQLANQMTYSEQKVHPWNIDQNVQIQQQHSPNNTQVLPSKHHHSTASFSNHTNSLTVSNPFFQSYNLIDPPEPSPHQELKMLAKIASSELGKINGSPERSIELNNNKTREKVKVYSQRIQNLNNFPSSTPYASSYKSRSIAMQRARATCITSSAKSLDILRQVMQARINEEIRTIIDRYISMYFRPALCNIRDNNGQSSVSEEHMQSICKKILEEASRMYMGQNSLRSRSPTPDTLADNLSDIASIASGKRSPKLPFGQLKRKVQSDSESEASSYKRKAKRGRPPGALGPSGLTRTEPVKREGPRWNPDRITTSTHFIMGSKANKALGLGNTRGRIYLKHPELFKYTGDSEDKIWLYENHRMPGTGGKAYMMILEDILDLTKSPEYKNSLDASCLKGFVIPDWMLAKAKRQMQSMKTDVTDATKPKLKSLTNIQQEADEADSDKNVPFTSAASSRKSLSDCKLVVNSPANTEEMELLSSEEMDDQPVSPFGSAEDYAPVSPGNSGSSLKPGSPLVIGLQHDGYSMT